MIIIKSSQYVKLRYSCSCGFVVILTKHRSLYESEKRKKKIDYKKVCEQCNNKVMKLEEKIFNKAGK